MGWSSGATTKSLWFGSGAATESSRRRRRLRAVADPNGRLATWTEDDAWACVTCDTRTGRVSGLSLARFSLSNKKLDRGLLCLEGGN
jgi:hypothetical protein